MLEFTCHVIGQLFVRILFGKGMSYTSYYSIFLVFHLPLFFSFFYFSYWWLFPFFIPNCFYSLLFSPFHQIACCYFFLPLKSLEISIDLILCPVLEFTRAIKIAIGEYLRLDLLVRHMPLRHSGNCFVSRAVGAPNQRFPHWKNVRAFMTVRNIISMTIYRIMERSMRSIHIVHNHIRHIFMVHKILANIPFHHMQALQPYKYKRKQSHKIRSLFLKISYIYDAIAARMQYAKHVSIVFFCSSSSECYHKWPIQTIDFLRHLLRPLNAKWYDIILCRRIHCTNTVS